MRIKVKDHINKAFFTRMITNTIDSINDPRKDLFLSLLKEAFNYNHIQFMANYFKSLGIKNFYKYKFKNYNSLVNEKLDLRLFNAKTNTLIRNIYSYKWWNMDPKNDLAVDTYNKRMEYLRSDINYKGVFDYLRDVISNLKEKLPTCQICLIEKSINCKKCLSMHNWKENELSLSKNTNFSSLKVIKPNYICSGSNIKIVHSKETSFKNLTSSITNDLSLIGKKFEDEETGNKLRFSLRKSTERESKGKYNVGNIFNKVEKNKRKKDGLLSNILNEINENGDNMTKLNIEEAHTSRLSSSVISNRFNRLAKSINVPCSQSSSFINLRDDRIEDNI